MEHEAEHEEHSAEIFCPVNAALNLLSERWTLHIVRALLGSRKRFNEIARELGLNPATLRERLRALEEENVVTRTVRSVMPPHVEYALTEKGNALNGIFEALAGWASIWMKPKGPEWVDIPLDDAADLGECESQREAH
jgi:DNA-binding HxlR family transcriptional regulator